jgi:hypothetical protein
MDNNISFNIGNFNLIKSDISLNKKNFTGFNDSDYKLVNLLNENNIDSAINNKLFVNSSAYIGFNLEDNNIKNNKIFNDNSLNVSGNSNFLEDITVNKDIYIKENSFFNNNIFINNSLILESEDITDLNIIYENTISLINYKKILANILENINSNNEKYSSINFISNNNDFISQEIASVNKKFIINDKNINCFLLVYILKINNKIITSKPILDTFIILNNDNIINISD